MAKSMNKLGQNIIYQVFYRVITVITPLLTSPYLSRILGVEQLGVYSATYAYANYYMLFAMLGVEYYGNRTIAMCGENPEKISNTFWGIYYVQLSAAVLSLAIYYASIVLIDGQRRLVALLQGLWIVAALLDINWFFFGRQQFKLTVTRNIIIKMVTIVSIFVIVKSKNDLWKYVAIMAGGTVLSQIVLWIYLRKSVELKKPSWDNSRKHIRQIAMLFIPVLAFSVFHIMDKSMVDLLSDETNGGCYYNVDRLVNIPLGIVTGVSTVMLPRISKMLMDSLKYSVEKLLEKSCEIVLCISCALAFGLGAIADEFVPLFFGEGYNLCVPLIKWFVPIILVKTLSDFIRQQYLIPSARDKLYVSAVCCGAVVNLIANAILIIHFGAIGAAIGTLLAETTVLFVEVIGALSEINFLKNILKQKWYFLMGIIMLLVVRPLANMLPIKGTVQIVGMIVGGAIVYMGSCFTYWNFSTTSAFHHYIVKINDEINKLKK